MKDSLEFALCEMQGHLFVMSAQRNIGSEAFIKAFMNSQVAKRLDSAFDHLQWAGKEYVFSEIEDECAESFRNGDIFDTETLFWAGYIYRFWHFHTGEDSRAIYKQAPAKTMRETFLMYHTLSPEMAVERLKAAVSRNNES